MPRSIIKQLHSILAGEVFEVEGAHKAKSIYIRVFNSRFNAINLANYNLVSFSPDTPARVIGKISVDKYGDIKETNTRFDGLFNAAIEGLIEFYEELENPDIVSGIKERIMDVDTGNDQKDYETIRNKVEGLVQNWIIDQRFF
jgi:hypothetical protein